jgi:hypothetical protein
LHVINADRCIWFFRYQRTGRERMMGLGGANDVSLDDARLAGLAARQLLRKGVDPIDPRQAERKAAAQEKAARTTFATVTENYIAAHEPTFLTPIWSKKPETASRVRSRSRTGRSLQFGRASVPMLSRGQCIAGSMAAASAQLAPSPRRMPEVKNHGCEDDCDPPPRRLTHKPGHHTKVRMKRLQCSVT